MSGSHKTFAEIAADEIMAAIERESRINRDDLITAIKVAEVKHGEQKGQDVKPEDTVTVDGQRQAPMNWIEYMHAHVDRDAAIDKRERASSDVAALAQAGLINHASTLRQLLADRKVASASLGAPSPYTGQHVFAVIDYAMWSERQEMKAKMASEAEIRRRQHALMAIRGDTGKAG